MILSYRDKRTAAFANREDVPAFRGIEQQAWKRLRILGAASSLNVLGALRSNRLEVLKGDRRDGSASASTINGGSVSGGLAAPLGQSTSR